MDAVYNRINNLKQNIQNSKEYKYRNQKPEEFSLTDEEIVATDSSGWYEEYHIIAHSGGGIAGETYLDCMEAWDLEYENGTRVFDADLSFTSDNYIVLRHSWYDDLGQNNIDSDHIPTYDEFMSTPVCYKYSPMDCEMMLDFMAEHNDVYVACDAKNSDADIFEYLVRLAEEKEIEDILDRIIISFYDYDDYQEIKDVYIFQNWAIRQYEYSPHNYYELCEYCVRNEIPVVMVTEKYLLAGDDISILTDHGISVWCAVVNDLGDVKDYKTMGISGVVSDYIYENDMVYIED